MLCGFTGGDLTESMSLKIVHVCWSLLLLENGSKTESSYRSWKCSCLYLQIFITCLFVWKELKAFLLQYSMMLTMRKSRDWFPLMSQTYTLKAVQITFALKKKKKPSKCINVVKFQYADHGWKMLCLLRFDLECFINHILPQKTKTLF